MKVIKRVFLWVMISVVLQVMIYLYLDRFYFNDETAIKITDVNDLNKNGVSNCNVTFPSGAKSIELSYDASYTSYFTSSNGFVLTDTESGKNKAITFNSSARCIAAKWLPDTNIIILAELSDKNTKLKFYSYDADKDEKKDIGNTENNNTTVNVKAGVVNVTIENSTLIGVMYIKVEVNGVKTMYRIDRNERMTQVNLNKSNVGEFKVVSHDDILAYADLTSKTIKTTGTKKTIKLDNKTDLQLLDTDSSNNIYVGNNVNGKVNEISFGKLNDDTSKWDKISLPSPVNLNQIVVSYSNGVYINDESGNVKNVQTNTQSKYPGTLISIIGGNIASIDNNKLVISKLN